MENWPTLFLSFLRQSETFLCVKTISKEFVVDVRNVASCNGCLHSFDYHISLTKAQLYQTHKYVIGYKKWDTFAYYLVILRLTMLWILKCIIGKSTFHICALCSMHLVNAAFTFSLSFFSSLFRSPFFLWCYHNILVFFVSLLLHHSWFKFWTYT